MAAHVAIEPSFTDDELKGLLTSIGGSHARRLTPVQVGRLLRRERDRGVSAGKLTAELGLAQGSSVVSWFLRLPDLPDEVQNLVEFGRPRAGLSLTGAAEIARLAPDVSAMRSLATLAVERQLTAGEIRSSVQIANRRRVSVSDAVSEVLRGRDVVYRRHVWIGRFAPTAAAALPQDAAARSDLLGTMLTEDGLEYTSATAGDSTFTIVLEQAHAEAAAAAGITAETTERLLNQRLAGGDA